MIFHHHGLNSYNRCCCSGRVSLPPYREWPQPLKELVVFSGSRRSPVFMRLIRQYNSLFAFTSLGVDVDNSVNNGTAPYVFRINGVVHHRIGSLIPESGHNPQYAQLYIYDTANEVANRISVFDRSDGEGQDVDPDIVSDLISMLNMHNPLVQKFRMARDRMFFSEESDISIRLVGSIDSSGDRFSLPVADELAALIVGDFTIEASRFETIVESTNGRFKHLSVVNPSLISLQCPLLFPYGDAGYHLGISYEDIYDQDTPARDRVSMLEYYSYHCLGVGGVSRILTHVLAVYLISLR